MPDIEHYLARWALVADGDRRVTDNGVICFVRQGARRAVLKLSSDPEEIRGGALMSWWAGRGAAQVLAHDGPALLLERAEGALSLSAMARTGQDDAACRIICSIAQDLHAIGGAPPAGLIPLDHRFRALEPVARAHGGLLDTALDASRDLLANPQQVMVLHGDLHHDNILDFGARGWRAIDPKGLWGERCFDFANIFLNPDLAHTDAGIATDPTIFRHRVTLVARAAGLPRTRLLRWILAWSGLSMAWSVQDGKAAPVNLTVAKLAAAALNS